MKMSSTDLTATNATKILSLLEEMYDLSYPQVHQKLNKYIQDATNTKLSFLVPILVKTEEMIIHVIGEKILGRELKFPVINNVLHTVVQSKKPTTINVTELDEEILCHIQPICPNANSFLAIPIQHPKQNYVALLVCLIDNDSKVGTTCKCAIVQECFRFFLVYFINSLTCYEETRLKHLCQKLLNVSRKLFVHLGHLSDLLREIMTEAKNLTYAERCSLFLLDPDQQDLVAKVFDGIAMKEAMDEMRIPIGQGIAGHVASTGKLLNIKNAYEHPLFYRGIDEVTGFRTRNILCFPIKNDKDKIVGVAQLCNKKDGLYFDVFDEEVATSFSIYCGISIMHGIVYRKMQDAQARSKLSNEIMMYHMKVDIEDIQELVNCTDEHNIHGFNEYEFSPRNVPYMHIACYIIKMLNELGLISHWKIKLLTLARFILHVKKGYRDAPYHNWIHAFSVTHFGYLLIRNLNLINENYMTHLEALVFLVSCLCHDIDHRGTNNAFQTKCRTILANLYSSEGSVMERHHFALTTCILNTEHCNIFENFNGKEYSYALDLLKNNILATDLVAHIRIHEKQEDMVKNKYDKNDPAHRKLFFSMLMTSCDLSDQTKHWRVSKKIAEKIYNEFFSQGDLEKSMGSCPIEMMDRERASIPDLQVQFITDIALPLYANLTTLFPVLKLLVDALKENRTLWEESKNVFQKYMEIGITGIDVLLDPTFEDQVLQFYFQRSENFSSNAIFNLELNKTESDV